MTASVARSLGLPSKLPRSYVSSAVIDCLTCANWTPAPRRREARRANFTDAKCWSTMVVNMIFGPGGQDRLPIKQACAGQRRQTGRLIWRGTPKRVARTSVSWPISNIATNQLPHSAGDPDDTEASRRVARPGRAAIRRQEHPSSRERTTPQVSASVRWAARRADCPIHGRAPADPPYLNEFEWP